ncbi:signal peptidase I [bacterium]|nr:signal peptidase I [bacterium]MBU1674854.1 signal peptidase I [bacterium]
MSQISKPFNRNFRLADALSTRFISTRRFVESIEAALTADVGLDAETVRPHLDPLRDHVDGTLTLTSVDMHRHVDALRALARETGAPYVVPAGMIFMMGDNRFNSQDSRYWGPLDIDLIRGKALFIYWSWDKAKKLPRLNRIGDLIR